MYQHSNIWESNVPMNISNILELGKTHQRNMLETLHLVTMVSFFFETIHWQPFGRPKGDESMFYRQVFKDPPAVRKSRLQSRVECGNSTACSSERSENTFRNNHFSLFYFNEVKSCFATFAFFRVILCSLNGEILSVSGAIFEGQYLHVWWNGMK